MIRLIIYTDGERYLDVAGVPTDRAAAARDLAAIVDELGRRHAVTVVVTYASGVSRIVRRDWRTAA